MLILGMDTTSVTASVAVADVDQGKVKKYSLFTVKTEMKHSENIMTMLDSALKMYGGDISQVEAFAVTSGPGSFTGVRIGVTTVKGLAFSTQKTCVDVSSLEAVAYNQNTDSTICVLMDARRNQFYYAFFRWDDDKLIRLTPDSADSAEIISEKLSQYDKVVVCGDGSYVFKELYSGNKKILYAKDTVREQNALSVVMCGYDKIQNGNTISCASLSPTYLRPSQAERNSKGE
jgi:tRNA threonylcarbamoyladenosine biosynthesis protein TsaB